MNTPLVDALEKSCVETEIEEAANAMNTVTTELEIDLGELVTVHEFADTIRAKIDSYEQEMRSYFPGDMLPLSRWLEVFESWINLEP